MDDLIYKSIINCFAQNFTGTISTADEAIRNNKVEIHKTRKSLHITLHKNFFVVKKGDKTQYFELQEYTQNVDVVDNFTNENQEAKTTYTASDDTAISNTLSTEQLKDETTSPDVTPKEEQPSQKLSLKDKLALKQRKLENQSTVVNSDIDENQTAPVKKTQPQRKISNQAACSRKSGKSYKRKIGRDDNK